METILVTGATGCVGSNLSAKLLEQGYRVRALRRASSRLLALEGVNVEYVLGDVRDKDSLRAAMRGCDTVFHTAAIVSFWKRRRAEQFEINVTGTRNVVEVCREMGVQKLVHTSSVAALGWRSDGELIDETTEYNWGESNEYKYSKHLAEREVLCGVGQGLDAVMVNPSVIIGPRDAYVHGGQLVRDTYRGAIPAYIAGGMNIVSVHGVVAGQIAAAQRGRAGERYILGGLNLTHKDVFALVARLLGKRSPAIKAPLWALRSVAKACDIIGDLTKRKPWISPELISGAGKLQWYSSAKAERELGYAPPPVENAILEAVEWYRRHGML